MFKEYIERHKGRFLEELFELLRIPSVSADSKYSADVTKAAEWVKRAMEKIGAKAEIHPTAGYPIVYGEYMVDHSKPTVLIYGHYDVQPPDPLDLWEKPPFEPYIKRNKIYARGACDDKGQFYMHLKALETLAENGRLGVNIKLIIEGEEEVGSDNLEIFVRENKDKLAADVVLVSDTGIISNEHPSITTGLRGLSYIEVEVTGPNRDLHSGMYGGQVANPINTLCEIIAKLKDQNGRITIPGFYDDVEEVGKDERNQMAKAPFSVEEYKDSLGIDALSGEKGYTTLERVSIRPSLDINGIWGGYTGEGAKTVIASKAYAKLSMRLVPKQNSEKATEQLVAYLNYLAPTSVKVKISPHHGAEPAVTPIDSKGYKAAEKAIQKAWGKKPIPLREGGSIPIVALFEKELGLKTVLMGFGLDEDAIHSPNESYGVENFLKGIESICYFHQYFSE